MDLERNLLFALLATRLGNVDLARFTEVAREWAKDSSGSLPKCLVESGVLSERDGRLIWALVKQAESFFKGDNASALGAFGGQQEALRSFHGSVAAAASGEVRPSSSGAGSPPDALSDVGKTVEESQDRYAYLGKQGQGGMGRVLLVHDEYLGRDVALKELLPAAGSGETPEGTTPKTVALISRFLREARVTGQLEHPSIVPVYELGRRQDGRPYYTMKLVRGRTLEKAIKDAGTLRERLKLLPHFMDLCQAVAYAHNRGVIHRDLKPVNVMVGEFGETVVLDWGLAKVRAQEDVHEKEMMKRLQEMGLVQGTDAGVTAVGQVIGTPAYMPPEQARGEADAIDERSDVYSLGAILYQLLAGRAPFEGENPLQIRYHVLEKEPEPVGSLEPQAPRELVAVTERAMAKQPDGRYPTVKELAEEIERFQSGRLVQTYEYKFSEHLRRFVGRHRAVMLTAAAAVVVLLAVSAFSYVRLLQENRRVVAASEQAKREFYYASIAAAKGSLDSCRAMQARTILASAPEEHRNWEWGYLQHLSNLDLVTLCGHSENIYDVAFSPGGKLLATASVDGTAIVWDVAMGNSVGTWGSEDFGKLKCVAFSPLGRFVAIGGDSSQVCAVVWDVETDTVVQRLGDGTGGANDLAFLPDGKRLVTSSWDGTTRLWDIDTAKETMSFTPEAEHVSSLALSPDGRTLATASAEDLVVRVWDVSTGSLISRFPGQARMGFSPNGELLAFIDNDNTHVVFWDVAQETEVRRLQMQGGLKIVCFTPDGQHLLTGGKGGHVDLWDIDTGSVLRTLVHSGTVHAVAVSPDGTRLATASNEGTAKIWDLAGQQQRVGATECPVISSSVVFTPDGDHLIALQTGQISILDVGSGRRVRTLTAEGATIDGLSISPDGRSLATVDGDGAVRLRDLSTGIEQWMFQGPTLELSRPDKCTTVFSPDGGQVGVVGDAGKSVLLNAKTGEFLRSLGGEGDVTCVAFSPNGKYMAVGRREEGVLLWDRDTGHQQGSYSIEGEDIGGAALSPTSDVIAVGGTDGGVAAWEVSSGRQMWSAKAHSTRSVASLNFSSDGSRLVTAGAYAMTAKLWDVATGREVMQFAQPDFPLGNSCFSPDGRHLVLSDSKKVAILPSFPWNEEQLPGNREMPVDERIRLYKLERLRRFVNN